MDLPLRVVLERTSERLVSVDGAWDQPGLNLSHWPGNRTPPELRHDLSTGIALAFARQLEARRDELAAGCTAIANNHFDTDGVCAVFAVRHPGLALARERPLLDAAAAGDFFQVPSEHAFQIDATISNLADPGRSPWGDRFAGLSEREKHEWLLGEIVGILPSLLDGDLAQHAELWQPELEDLRRDRAELAAAERDEIVHLDLAVWTSRRPPFDPGRHALFGSTRADRVLAIGAGRAGTTYRLLLGTLSWFDLVTRTALPRPDLAGLAARLNGIEGCAPSDAHAWRFQDVASPSPELWFGAADLEWFPERSPALRESRLAPAVVRREIADALRRSWTFPD